MSEVVRPIVYAGPRPTIGSNVLYHQPAGEIPVNGSRVHPAIITSVHSHTCVNLHVFFDANPSKPVTSAMHIDGAPIDSHRWEWPPRV